MRAGHALALASLASLALALAVSGCGGGSHHAAPARTTPSAPTPTSPTVAPAPAPGTAFGTDVDPLFLNGPAAGDPDRQLARAAADGLRLARVAPLWEFTEPRAPVAGRHLYDWSYDDGIARRLAAHGLRWLALLAYTPGWASATPTELHGAPTTPSDYAAYAAAIAARYRGQIAAYEIWNEENSAGFWGPAPDPAAYARLYLAARAAIHRVDPGVPVLIGGLANPGEPFLAELLGRPELSGQIDGVAVHPYGRDPTQVLSRVRAYRLELRELGAGQLPLYVTEYGWVTNPRSAGVYATAAQRARFIPIVAEALLHSDCLVRMVIFYAWTTIQKNPGMVGEWYGVASPDGRPNAGGAAVAAAERALAAPAGASLPICAS